MRPFRDAVRPMATFLWLFVITTIWVLYSRNNILNLEPRIMLLLFGALFSNIASRFIVAQMSDTRCDSFNILLWPLVLTVAINCFPWYEQLMGIEISADTARWILQALTMFVTIAYFLYGMGVVLQNKTGKMRPFRDAVRPMATFLWLFVITTIWVLYSRNNILNLEPRILLLLFCALFSNIASRFIVAQMSDTRCDSFNILLWPLVLTVAINCFPWYEQLMGIEISADTERWILQALTMFVTIAYFLYGMGVIKPPNPPEQELQLPNGTV